MGGVCWKRAVNLRKYKRGKNDINLLAGTDKKRKDGKKAPVIETLKKLYS